MLTLIERKRVNGKLIQKALFRCHCGNTKWMLICNAKRSISCGCYLAARMSELNKSHGLKNHPLYNVWANIKRRCLKADYYNYKDYGGRGITICEEWLNPENFIKWCLNNGYEKGLHIDRINNNGNYEPNNCRFVTAKENNNNKRSNKLVTYNNETHTISQWANIIGKSRKLIGERLRSGWSIERAFS